MTKLFFYSTSKSQSSYTNKSKLTKKLYKVQLEQDQLKRELDEAKIQLEQVRLQTDDTSSSSDDDGHQIQESYPQRNRTKINHKAFERHHSLPTLREANQAAIRHPIKKEIPIRRNTAYSTTSNGGSISQILTTTANIR